MIRSMTGFGEAAGQHDGVHYGLELRSLNNRYFKATIRLPEEIAGLEAEIEGILRQRLVRGSVTLNIRLRMSGAAAAHQVNDDALVVYLEHLETVKEKVTHGDHHVNIDLTALLALPGVLQPSEEADNFLEKARPVVLPLVEAACDKLVKMRIIEGEALAEDLLRQCQAVRERIEVIAGRGPVVIEEYHTRLRSRVDDLLARAQLKMGENDLIREVAIYAERSDISEEISRTRGHLDQLKSLVENRGGEPVGRTLDFLAQELLREANTIASKSNDSLISRAIVEVKGAIDRIKEQAANVE